ncbi:hypothetical protein VTI28DRAFT_7105 [Corynascus sepedonium]
MDETVISTTVRLYKDEYDGCWEVNQVDQADPEPEDDDDGQFQWGYGPIECTGSVDTDTFQATINVFVMGIDLGTVYGDLNDNIKMNLYLHKARGKIEFYSKHGNELWIHFDVKIMFNGTYEADRKIRTY